jgi:ribosomal protein S27E
MGTFTDMAGREPFERLQCGDCGAHSPVRDHAYCSVCGGTKLTPVEGPPLMTGQPIGPQPEGDGDGYPGGHRSG